MSLNLPWLDERVDVFPSTEKALINPNGLLAAGGDLSSPRLLAAYMKGIFPWYSAGEPILWWFPNPRCVFFTDRMYVSTRLKRWFKNASWTIQTDKQFEAVINACARPRAQHNGTWITPEMREAYVRLYSEGHAHSIEVIEESELVGGLYGVVVGRMFFAESMFSFRSNASKIALLALARLLRDNNYPVIDAQISSDHLFSLGALELSPVEFTNVLEKLVNTKAPKWPQQLSFSISDL
jgi:leucyl/phenylalanyl-tRNA--protein transferase